MHDPGSTIVAVATAPGRGGVGCVRISGPDADSVAEGLFRPLAGAADPESNKNEPAPGRTRFGRFVGRGGKPVDHGYAVRFVAGRSFTGEPTVELWPHGSPAVLAELVAHAVERGARAAEAGEFTYRALIHGRIDLARAEAVRDLVAARTLFQARVAFAQAEGALSRRVAPACEALEELIARAEAAVEFVDESETHLPRRDLSTSVRSVRERCETLLGDFEVGRVVRDGATLAMVGHPNVGKSSLFNRLLRRERAIVTEVAGTTRDTLEETVDLEGIPLRLIDTAGLRSSDDPVESEGIRRAERARDEADLVMLVLDGSRPMTSDEEATLREMTSAGGPSRTLVVVNKADLDPAFESPEGALRVSARDGRGLDGLHEALRRRLVGDAILESPILTDRRHAAALTDAVAALDRAESADGAGYSEECVLEDLREARRRLGAIRGEFSEDELYDRIFSTFCIGK